MKAILASADRCAKDVRVLPIVVSESETPQRTGAIKGGHLVKLYRDGAVIEHPGDRSQRVYQRRRLDAANVTLPWIGLRWRPDG